MGRAQICSLQPKRVLCMKKNWVLYFLCIIALILFGLWLLQQGQDWGQSTPVLEVQAEAQHFWHPIEEGIRHPLSIFLLQILVIIISARLLGWLMGKMGQPSVMGEIVAGILLGPSLLGWLVPDFFGFLFKSESLGNLQLISQLGLVLFMFTVGMELDLRSLRQSALDVVLISQSSIIVPYVMGIALAWILYSTYAPSGVSFVAFALFIGIALSVTAFPVLARIVQERGLNKSPLGSLALAAAAINDVLAWCILAAIIALVRTGPAHSALLTIGLSVLYVLFMLYVLRPLLARVANRFFSYETMNRTVIGVIFAVLLLSALLTEIIGIHALFGAFLAGVIIPQNEEFRHVIINKVEDLTVVLLLPLFFVFTGLRTQIGLLNTPELWQTCALIILVAVLGKVLGSAIPARISGQSWYDALALGALMNTRGLMELIVLNIGFDLGILSPEIFAMMVLMALATTFMTGPALNTLQWVQGRFQGTLNPETAKEKHLFRLLISFGQPRAGVRLLQLAQQLRILGETHALHFTPNADISIAEAEIFEKEGFEPILNLADRHDIDLHTHYKASNNVPQEIIQHANRGVYDLMLIGSSRPLFSSDETGGMVQTFFENIGCPIGVLIDKGFTQIKKVLLVYYDEKDRFLLNVLVNCAEITNGPALQILSQNQAPPAMGTMATKINWQIQSELEMTSFREYDLLVISRNFWEIIKQKRYELMAYAPSILILHSPETA